MRVLDWLLGDDSPGVQYLTRTRLLGESGTSRRNARLRARCNDYPPAGRMLDRVDRAMAAGNYKKYQGAYWTLIFLADLQADGRDARARRLADHVLATQLDNGGFSAAGDAWTRNNPARFEIVCLTANLLRALVHLGYGEDDRVVRGYHRLGERILAHGGVPCVVLRHCLQTSCKMTLPQTLRAIAATPAAVPNSTRSRVRQTLVGELLGIRVYRYARPDHPEYRAAVRRRPKGMPATDVRDRWMAQHRYSLDQLAPKERWKRFGFPRSYNPDLLEAMLALAELEVPYDPAMEEALEHIERKRGRDGRWKMDDSLNGQMQASVERKGAASKWITLRALTVLQHFGRIPQL